MLKNKVSQASVVLIEDQISMRKALMRMLDSTMGFKVEEFGSARDAIDFLKTHQVDLVISDIFLPKGSGMDVLRYVRNRPVANDIPVIFVTGEATKDDIVQAVDLGVSDYLIKPFEPPEFLSKVKLVLEKFRHPSERLQRLRQGESHFFSGRIAEAISLFQSLVDEEADSVRVMVSLAQAKAYLGQTEEALELITTAIGFAPMYFPAYAVATDLLLERGRKSEAMEYLEKEIAIHGKQPQRRMMLADLLFEANSPKAALEQIRQALVDNPRDETVLLKMAELLFNTGDIEKSVHYYLKTRRKNPHCTNALDGLAQLYVSTGQTQKAFKMLADLLKSAPAQKDVLIARARLFEKTGDHGPALCDVDTYLISDPENIEAHLVRGRLLIRLNQAKEAQATWNEIEGLSPTADAFGKIGLVCLHLNRFEMARRYYEKAVLLDPQNSKYVFSLGYALENLKLFGTAAECYYNVLKIFPGSAEAKEALSRVQKKTRRAG
jgi:tetratricopeptide (TPR) repeat protein